MVHLLEQAREHERPSGFKSIILVFFDVWVKFRNCVVLEKISIHRFDWNIFLDVNIDDLHI